MKKTVLFVLSFLMCLTTAMPVFAAEDVLNTIDSEVNKFAYSETVKLKTADKFNQNINSNISAKAVTGNGTTQDGFSYEIIDRSYAKITDYTGSLRELVIPSEINGYPVKIIGDRAFASTGVTTSIKIPDTVESIGNESFASCNALISIEIPNSIISIGDKAFNYCNYLKNVEIPESVRSIGERAFIFCRSLTSINVSENNPYYSDIDGVLLNKDKTVLLQYPIGKTASSYTVPNSVKLINVWSFTGNSKLTDITISDNVEEIAYSAFRQCSSLINVTFGKNLKNIGNNAFTDCKSLISIEVPYGVETISPYAFSCCWSLKNVNISNSVTSIGIYAFAECKSLTGIDIPNSIDSIASGTFWRCSSLARVNIPDSVISILGVAFQDCRSLINIEIPDSVTEIDHGVFNGCYKLTIYGSGGSCAEKYAKDENIPFIAGKLPQISANGLKYSIISDKYIEILGYSDDKALLTEMVIPSEIRGYPVKSIGDSAFSDCSYLISIVIPASVTSIGNGAFYNTPASLTIYGESGSYAQTYANENNIRFIEGTPTAVPTTKPNTGDIALKPDSEYILDLENGTLSGVEEMTSLKELISNFENGESLVVTKGNGDIVTDENALIGTGYIVKIVDKNGNVTDSVVVIVMGDVTGDAIVNSRDIAAMQKHLVQINALTGAYLSASDLTADGTLNSRDIAQLQKKLTA